MLHGKIPITKRQIFYKQSELWRKKFLARVREINSLEQFHLKAREKEIKLISRGPIKYKIEYSIDPSSRNS